jgi:hypothetical protein
MGVKVDRTFTGGNQRGEQAPEPQEPDPPEHEAEPDYRFTPGGNFILDTDPEPKALWGDGDRALWADGEALIIAGAQGLGKTTLAQQLTLAGAASPGTPSCSASPSNGAGACSTWRWTGPGRPRGRSGAWWAKINAPTWTST